MQAAAATPTLFAICFRCHARYAESAPSACPGCGGAVILEMAQERPDAESLEEDGFEPQPASDGLSHLPGVHVKLAPREREALALACRDATRRGGGTSVHARGARGEGGWAVKLVSMAALLATFAFFLQSAH